MRTYSRESKRQRTGDDDNSERTFKDPPRVVGGSSQCWSGQEDIRHEYRGGLSVIRFLRLSSLLIAQNTQLSLVANRKILSLLHGMKIRNTHGKVHKIFTFHGLTSDVTRDFQAFVEDGDEEFELKYKLLPYLDMGVTANGKPIYLPMEWCAIYSKDNESHERLRSLVYPETPREQPDVNNDNNNEVIKKRWRLVFFGQNAAPCTESLTKFRECMEIKCGESSSKEIIYIGNVKEVKEKLVGIEGGGTSILLCVTEKRDKAFIKDMKREAELEKGIQTFFCKLEFVEHYCDLYNVTDLQESLFVRDITQEMIAKTASREYRDKLLLPRRAFPPRFESDGKCHEVMYVGCKVISAFSFPHLTFLVGNISSSDRSTSGYVSRVAAGDYMEKFPAIFGEMLEKYKEKHEGNFPDRLILFRQGFVGGQIEDMLRKEVDALREKLDGVGGEEVYVPITFIVRRKKSGPHSVNIVGDEKGNYSIFADENAMCRSELETLVKNLVYSKRYPKPLPVYYTNRAVHVAKAYLEGTNNPNMEMIAQAIDRNLYVRGEGQNKEQQNRRAEQQHMEE